MTSIVKIIFTYDRPLQLWGLIKSILDNSDLGPERIICIAKSTSDSYRKAYDVVAEELGPRVIHEPPAPEGLLRRFNRHSLYDMMLRHSANAEFVTLGVDDMMYFRKTSFADATRLMEEDPDICVWCWRIGRDLQPHEMLQVRDTHWRWDRMMNVMPYRYVFHVDGSVYRRRDFVYWLKLLPVFKRRTMTLNEIEGRLSGYTKPKRAKKLRLGRIVAGPLLQTSILWQINKVSESGGAAFCETAETGQEHLLRIFNEGRRLDYSSLYGRTDWIIRCNAGWPQPPTHIASTEEAARLWARCITGA